jgi:hypothetical protein
MRHWWLLVVATALSSGLGLRGNLWVWAQSVAGDAVFVATTMGAFLLTRRMTDPSLAVAMLAAFPLHWLAYGVSWSVTIGEPLDASLLRFVLGMGWMGLAWCVVAVPLIQATERSLAAANPRQQAL